MSLSNLQNKKNKQSHPAEFKSIAWGTTIFQQQHFSLATIISKTNIEMFLILKYYNTDIRLMMDEEDDNVNERRDSWEQKYLCWRIATFSTNLMPQKPGEIGKNIKIKI